MAGLVRNRTVSYQRVPGPEGMSGEEASTIYRTGPGAYPEMEMPATHFVTAATRLQSSEIVPSVLAGTASAGIVNRRDRMKGYQATAGIQAYDTPVPPMYDSPYSSKFQELLIGPHVNFILNGQLYRCGFPSALAPGRRPLYLSTRVDQLVTRASGGPGPAQMTTSQRRFSKVQNIPRYSTTPRAYPTQSAPG